MSPLHDFQCFDDGTLLADQYRSVTEGAQSRPPLCPACGNRMTWRPQAAFDLRTDGSPAFAKFTTYDGHNNPVVVDSLHAVRKLERESEQAYRNGEGQPLVFRAWSQTRGNRLDPTLGEPAAPALSAAGKRKFGLQGGARSIPSGGGEPDIPFGPGINESNASALKE
jgi:hypothetical protein